MQMINFIQVPNSVQYAEWFTDKNGNTLRVLVALLCICRHEPTTVHGHQLNDNELMISRTALTKRLNLTDRNIRTALTNLENTGYISTRNTNTGKIITITAADKYGFAPIPRKHISPFAAKGFDINEFKLTAYMYIKAAHPDTEFNGVKVQQGSFFTDNSDLASGTGLTIRQVRYLLETENKMNCIVLSNKTTNEKRPKNRLITVFFEYDTQKSGNQNDQPTKTTNKTTNEPTNENGAKSQYLCGFAENEPQKVAIKNGSKTQKSGNPINISSIEYKYIFDNQSINQGDNNLSAAETTNEPNRRDDDRLNADKVLISVRDYFAEQGFCISADEFYSAYFVNGKWINDKGQPLNSWQGFARYKNQHPDTMKQVRTGTATASRQTAEPTRTAEPITNNNGASYDLDKAIAKSNSIPQLDKAHKSKLNQVNGTDTASGTGTDTQNGNNTEIITNLERRLRG